MSGKNAHQHSTNTLHAIILAGGKGRRLLPYTTSFPKPLMPVSDIPILEIVLRQLARDGFTEVTLAVGHLASLIEAYCGDGAKFGVSLQYLKEEQPLGTAGPLTRLSAPPEHFLVMNGDLLTDVDYREIYQSHISAGATASIMTISQEVPIDYGVLTTDDANNIITYEEKPQLKVTVSGGVYVFSRRVLQHIPPNTRFDFPDLVQVLLDKGETVRSYEHHGYWLDIGRRDDYQQANDLFEQHREVFWPPPQSLPQNEMERSVTG